MSIQILPVTWPSPLEMSMNCLKAASRLEFDLKLYIISWVWGESSHPSLVRWLPTHLPGPLRAAAEFSDGTASSMNECHRSLLGLSHTFLLFLNLPVRMLKLPLMLFFFSWLRNSPASEINVSEEGQLNNPSNWMPLTGSLVSSGQYRCGSPSSLQFLGPDRGSCEECSREVKSQSRTRPREPTSSLLADSLEVTQVKPKGFFVGPGLSGTQACQFSNIPHRMCYLCPCKHLSGNIPRALCTCNSSCVLWSCWQATSLNVWIPGNLFNLLRAQYLAQVLPEGTHCYGSLLT